MDNKTVCKYCGEIIDAQAGFCPVCGAVNRILSKQDPEKKYCRFCGGELGDAEEYCKICGTPVKRRIEGEKRSSIENRDYENKISDLKKKAEEEGSDSGNPVVPAESSDGKEQKEPGGTLNFLQKAAIKQQEDAELEKEYEKKRVEELRAIREENEKLKASATRAYGSNLQSPRSYGSGSQPTQTYAGTAGEREKRTELESKAAEAGVSVEEILLFEQAKSQFESENETYPDDYNVNDYDQFDYSQSRYGAYNMGSLELESMQYRKADDSREETEDIPEEIISEPKEENGVIGGKKKKTPLGVRIMMFFIAIIAVAGLAAIITYVFPMMRNVHPEEMLLDESAEPAELSITPISAATSTPTPTVTPTPTMTPTPTVDAIVPQSITPSPIPTDTPTPTPTEVPTPEEEEYDEEEYDEEEYDEEEENETEPVIDPGELSSGYLVADSDSRVMDPSELDGRSPEEIRLIANEIYARYGYTFQNEYYAEYFSQFDWYTPSVPVGQFSEDIMSAEAQENLNMIAQYEEEHGY